MTFANIARVALISSGVVLVLSAAPARAQQTARIRGTITAVNGQTLDVAARSGEKVSVTMAPDTRIMAILPAKLIDVTSGSYIGTAAMPQPDGSLRALEVQVFPDNMRGIGEGSRPFDLLPDSTMTNGTVGTVLSEASGPGGRTLDVLYQGGKRRSLFRATCRSSPTRLETWQNLRQVPTSSSWRSAAATGQ